MNRLLTERCWKRFCAWYATNYQHKGVNFVVFQSLPFDMQIGVYVKYFDSLGLRVYLEDHYPSLRTRNEYNSYSVEIKGVEFSVKIIKNHRFDGNLFERDEWFKTREDAYKSAFLKADKIYNDGE